MLGFVTYLCLATRPQRLTAGSAIMTCQDLARQIQQLEPQASPQDVARLCLLLTNSYPNLASLDTREQFQAAWRDVCLKLQFATDQHAAMTQELEELAASDPEKYSHDQVWVLIRAIKVQSQILQLYVGHPVLDV